jgi:iodotyrosine deiodinase
MMRPRLVPAPKIDSQSDDEVLRRAQEFYAHRAPKAWLEALAPLSTDSNKPFLEIAPWLIAVFAQPFRILTDGTRSPAYYAIESVGIATGMLVTAVRACGLVSLTHTPSPMEFINRILGRPSHEEPFCAPGGWRSRGKRAGP